MEMIELRLVLPREHAQTLLGELAYGAALDQFGCDYPFLLVEKVKFRAESADCWAAIVTAGGHRACYQVVFDRAAGQFQTTRRW